MLINFKFNSSKKNRYWLSELKSIVAEKLEN